MMTRQGRAFFAVVCIFACMVFTETRQCHEKFKALTDFHGAGSTKHSACLDAASTLTKSGVSDADKTLIVNKHNEYRTTVADTYKATNMQKMVWDDEIAAIAQAYAENCEFSHDDSWARRIPGRFGTGQNLAAGYSDWSVAVKGWYDEVKDFNYGGTHTGVVGHFTQLAAAGSAKIGCGYAECSNLSYKLLYICNYGPAGNVGSDGQNKPWKSGSSACSDCPNSCSNKLCDCGGKVCLNYGTIDVNTCGCTCSSPKSMYVGDDCSLDCSKGPVSCPYNGDAQSQCKSFANVPFECPEKCKHCPYGGIAYNAKKATTQAPKPTTKPGDSSATTKQSAATTPSGDNAKTTEADSSGSRAIVRDIWRLVASLTVFVVLLR